MVTRSTLMFEVIPSDLQVRPALHVALVSVNGKKIIHEKSKAIVHTRRHQ